MKKSNFIALLLVLTFIGAIGKVFIPLIFGTLILLIVVMIINEMFDKSKEKSE